MKKIITILIVLALIASVLIYRYFHRKPDTDIFFKRYEFYRESGLDAEDSAIKACKDANIKN